MSEENASLPPVYFIPCDECHSGVLRLQYVTYMTWLDESMVTVPNFPAWICDVCGRREYDSRAISWLNTLLNPHAGKRPRSQRKSPPSQAHHPRPGS